jgi:hypothetical protein
MAEIMNPDTRQAGLAQSAVKPLAHAASIQRAAGGSCENETLASGQLLLSLPSAVLSERTQCARRQVHSSSTPVRLGFDKHHSPEPLGQPLESALDHETSPLEVQVGPGQTEGLSEAQSSRSEKYP